MVHFSKSTVLLLIFTFFCVYCENVQAKNNRDLIRNNNHKIINHDVSENNINVAGDSARRVINVNKNRQKFISDVLESDEAFTDYCDCESPNTQPIYICINYFPVPSIVRKGGSYYGNATFVKDEVVHITCKRPTNSSVDVRILGVIDLEQEMEIDLISASEIDIKLSTYDSYKIECFADDTINTVLLTSGGSYTYPVKDVSANIEVNGLVLSPLCMKYITTKYVNIYYYFKYFTFEAEKLLIDAKFKDNRKHDCYRHVESGDSAKHKIDNRLPFEFIKNKSEAKCNIACFINNQYELLITIEVQFVNYRVTEPFVYGLSWSRAYKRYVNNNEIVAEYLYKKNETLRLAVVSEDPKTIVILDNKEIESKKQQLGKYYYQALKMDPFLNKSIFVRNEKGSNSIKFIQDGDDERIGNRGNIHKKRVRQEMLGSLKLLKTTSPKLPTSPTTTSQKPQTSPTTSQKPPTSPKTPQKPPTSPTTSQKPPTSPKTPQKPPTSPKTTSQKPPTSPTTSQKPPTSPATTSQKPPTSPTTTSPTTSDSNVLMMVIIVVSSISLGILIGAVLTCLCLRAAKRAEPSVVYSRCKSHIYEELQNGINIAERPPYPLPNKESINDNISYTTNIHYDTPYEWRQPCSARWNQKPLKTFKQLRPQHK